MGLTFALLFYLCLTYSSSSPPPHIVLIVADDLGYNDVSWHNPDILSPNLARLAQEGVVLEQHYVQPICTPTRSALMSGRYPIHTGRQHGVLWPEEPRGLHAHLRLLPQELQALGYRTHMVGKWHLGLCSEEFLPTRRGFDTFYGYYTGSEDYYLHSRASSTPPITRGYDLRDQEAVALAGNGTYSAHLFSARAASIIGQLAGSDQPMFLYLAFQSVHSPLQVPEKYEEPFRHIKNRARRTFSGMVMAMDEAIGKVTAALEEAGMAENTLIVFTSDNGGQTRNGGNNFPLRGNKNTLWEGGTRAAALVHGSMLAGRGGESHRLLHVTDWLPTLVTAAGGDSSLLAGLDGVDQWAGLTEGTHPARVEMLYNIDPVHGDRNLNGPGGAIRLGPFKLIRGDPGRPDGWIRPDSVVDEEEAGAMPPGGVRRNQLLLFHLEDDPTERRNLVAEYPAITRYLATLLDRYQASMEPPDVAEKVPEGNPIHWGGFWSPGWCNASTVNTIL